MLPSLQKPLAATLFLTALLGTLTLLVLDPTGAADEVLPRVEKPEHKGYHEATKGSYRDGSGQMVEIEASFDMVPIPGGSFLMGSPASEKGRGADEGPQHPVTIRPFWMGKCEVTWDEFDVYWREKGLNAADDFDKIRKENPDAITGPTRAYGSEGAPDYSHDHSGHPALSMTHHAGMEYCRWLSAKTGKAYRLPTEAEWEWAARCGTRTAYFFGDDPAQLKNYAWYRDNSEDKAHDSGTTHKVGTKKPNPWGLHDMYGNVMEWCVDHYQKDYYADCVKNKLTLGPVLLPTANRFSHVARGGSWTDEAVACRSAARTGSEKSWIKRDPQVPQSIWWLTRMDMLGFRVVVAVNEQANLKGIKSQVTRDSR